MKMYRESTGIYKPEIEFANFGVPNNFPEYSLQILDKQRWAALLM
jgi:hypothetical protein